MSARVSCIAVHTPSKSYEIYVGSGLLSRVGEVVRGAGSWERAFIVSDSHVAPLYLQKVQDSLNSAGIAASSFVFPAGEKHKNAAQWIEILEAMAEAQISRDAVVVALGGGVVGDMAGFAAASYMRGIDVVQVPTSLLAMVDSSVGGKTAIDLTQGKNLVGAFLQPSLVVVDTTTLTTLPDDVFADGCAEVIKHAMLADATLFERLHTQALRLDSPELDELIAQNICIKRDVVEQDETEKGLRQTLNLGHSIGHAVEACSNYTMGHGHAVAIGLAAVTRAAERMGWAQAGYTQELCDSLHAHNLATSCPYTADELLKLMKNDKKRSASGLNLIIPCRPGEVCIKKLADDELANFVKAAITQSNEA